MNNSINTISFLYKVANGNHINELKRPLMFPEKDIINDYKNNKIHRFHAFLLIKRVAKKMFPVLYLKLKRIKHNKNVRKYGNNNI